MTAWTPAESSELVSLGTDFLPDVRWAREPIRILLCDDHSLFRRGMMVALEEEGDMEVVGESDLGSEAAHLAQLLAPDVIMVDMALPPYGCVPAVAEITRTIPTARILLLVAHERHPAELLEAVGAGVTGVILKEDALDLAAASIRSIRRGGAILTPTVARALSDQTAELDAAGVDIPERERLLIEILARGGDTDGAATGLGLDAATARSLVLNLIRRLQHQWRAEDIRTSLARAEPSPDRLAAVAEEARQMHLTMG